MAPSRDQVRPTPFPLVVGGKTYTREDILSLAVDRLVDSAQNEGGDDFDPDPAVNARRINDAAIWALQGVDGEYIDTGGLVLADADLAEVVERARAALVEQLGYVPSGEHRHIDFNYRRRDFGASALPDRDGLWYAELIEWNPDFDEEIGGMPSRLGRSRPASDEFYATPAAAVAAVVEVVIAALDAGEDLFEGDWFGDEASG
jgi:hypothetical protein